MTVDLGAFDRKVGLAFRRTVRDVEVAARAAHDEVIWGWSGSTRRENGSTASSPRNVVDLGTLRNSQQPAVYAGLSARVVWTAEHAAATYLGAVFRKRAYSLPARNVPRYALQKVNLVASFDRHLRALR
ncbi:hypothetical protein [Deinococcus sp. QL22]|uniref:hypothetical protein n=1 Tax=Deinococcus sp. QL22 TaxID=2939437 RepID=UPI002017BAF5|nr:hypothetical protein [Deinococcus sp. QL22]UQN10369.1 hypothetical protein M1R55_29905 [Deinococcus sp. QL22]UQN10503.1 hypothetical protein M1R55_29230 [Deinococcus sp. QL22]